MTSVIVPTALRVPTDRYRPAGVLRSEFTKLRTVRSTVWSLAVLVVATVVVGVLVCRSEASSWAHLSASDRSDFDPTNVSLSGVALGQLAVGVLGILVITAEFSTGAIRSTFSAVPNRRLVLAAKAAVFGGVVLLVGEIVSFVTFLLGQAILSGQAPHATLGQAGVLRAVVFSGIYLAGTGLLALGLGTIIRHTAGAIAAFSGLVFVIPALLGVFPQSIQNSVGHFFPPVIGSAMVSVAPGAAWSPWTALGLLSLYVVLSLGIGGWLLQRRDP